MCHCISIIMCVSMPQVLRSLRYRKDSDGINPVRHFCCFVVIRYTLHIFNYFIKILSYNHILWLVYHVLLIVSTLLTVSALLTHCHSHAFLTLALLLLSFI